MIMLLIAIRSKADKCISKVRSPLDSPSSKGKQQIVAPNGIGINSSCDNLVMIIFVYPIHQLELHLLIPESSMERMRQRVRRTEEE